MKNPCAGLAALLLIFSFSLDSSAQRKEDVLYLSNGSVIHGVLLNDSSDNRIRMLSRTGDIWALSPSEVDSITRERPFEYKAVLFNQPGFEFGISADFLMRSGSGSVGKAVIPGINLILGYRFNPCLSVGMETGIQFYERMEVPFSASLRARLSGRSLSPLGLIRAGYTLPAEKRPDDSEYSYESHGGFHGSIGVGMERILNENTSLLLTFAYHYQVLNYHLRPLNQWNQERDRSEQYSRFRLTAGYVFK
jgi:hypothetical protein